MIVLSLVCGVKVLRLDGDRIVPVRSFPLAMGADALAVHTWTLVSNFWYGVRMRGAQHIRQVDITSGVETKLPFPNDYDRVRPRSHPIAALRSGKTVAAAQIMLCLQLFLETSLHGRLLFRWHTRQQTWRASSHLTVATSKSQTIARTEDCGYTSLLAQQAMARSSSCAAQTRPQASRPLSTAFLPGECMRVVLVNCAMLLQLAVVPTRCCSLRGPPLGVRASLIRSG